MCPNQNVHVHPRIWRFCLKMVWINGRTNSFANQYAKCDLYSIETTGKKSINVFPFIVFLVNKPQIYYYRPYRTPKAASFIHYIRPYKTPYAMHSLLQIFVGRSPSRSYLYIKVRNDLLEHQPYMFPAGRLHAVIVPISILWQHYAARRESNKSSRRPHTSLHLLKRIVHIEKWCYMERVTALDYLNIEPYFRRSLESLRSVCDLYVWYDRCFCQKR